MNYSDHFKKKSINNYNVLESKLNVKCSMSYCHSSILEKFTFQGETYHLINNCISISAYFKENKISLLILYNFIRHLHEVVDFLSEKRLNPNRMILDGNLIFLDKRENRFKFIVLDDDTQSDFDDSFNSLLHDCLYDLFKFELKDQKIAQDVLNYISDKSVSVSEMKMKLELLLDEEDTDAGDNKKKFSFGNMLSKDEERINEGNAETVLQNEEDTVLLDQDQTVLFEEIVMTTLNRTQEITKEITIKSKGHKKKLSVNNAQIVLGRNPLTCDYILDNKHVSKRHAQLTQYEDQIMIEDLDSKNGTYVNQVRIEPCIKVPIKSGSKVYLANSVIKISF